MMHSQTAMIDPAPRQPPNGPLEILTPCSPQRRAALGSAETSLHLEPAQAPQNAHEKGGGGADRRSRRYKVSWLAGEPVQIGPVSDRHSLLTGKLTGNFAKSGSFQRF